MLRLRHVAVGAAAAGSLLLVAQSDALSYGVRVLTAVLATAALLRVGTGTSRWSRALLAAALGAGIASGVAATGHLLVTGQASPPGGLADWLYLAYGPLAVGGLLALPRHWADGPWRLNALMDAVIAVASLGFVLAGLFSDMAARADQSPRATAAALGYPVMAVFVLAVTLSMLPRAHADLRPFLHRVAAGFTLMTLADIGYSFGALHGWYQPTTWPALLTQGGLLLVGAAPYRARRAFPVVAQEPAAPSLLEATAPYLPCLLALPVSVGQIIQGQRYSLLQAGLVVAAGLALVVRQLAANAEQLRTIGRLRTREQEATATSLQDPLTGLSNRTALHRGLSRLLAQGSATLVLVDLDDFKDINDTHGHDTGDAVLRQIALRLRAAVPRTALVARLGGDEFVVCAATRLAPRLDQDVVLSFCDPVVLGRRPFAVTASIGVVVTAPGDGDATAALSHADVAMYQAKADKAPHRSTVVVLEGPSRARAAARIQMREEVSQPSLEQFRVVYEPIVDLVDGSIVGAEALLRWRHPVLGDVPPNDFVPLAEQVGAIQRLGEHALRRATAALADWRAEAAARGWPLGRATIGVNLSPRQLAGPGLCDLVREVLTVNRLEPYRLVLEITEQALLDDWDTAVEVVSELRSIGVAVAVDDFGTGYSSLRYLRRFDTSTVKIDKEFVQAAADEPRTRALVASVLEMARSLDLYTVAEGVETLHQLRVLRELGCQFAQGYLFTRPLEKEAFGELLVGGRCYPVEALPTQLLRASDRPPARAVAPAAVPVVPRRPV
jgi:diguanylate cyclase (GGDEF)-like protein